MHSAKLQIEAPMNFVAYTRRLETEAAVIRHELGHALLAYKYGMVVGRMAFARDRDGVLGGSARTAHLGTFATRDEQLRINVMRLLAGEVAARTYLGMVPQDVCCDLEIATSMCVSEVLRSIHGSQQDIAKAIYFATTYAGEAWFELLSKCHEEAEQIVAQGWTAIETMAPEIEHMIRLAEPKQQILIPGLWLITRLEVTNVTPVRVPPAEGLHQRLLGDQALRAIRATRLAGNPTLIIFDDNLPSAAVDFPLY